MFTTFFKESRMKRFFVVALVGLFLTSVASAQVLFDAPIPGEKVDKPLNLTVGLDVTNAYYLHGVLQERTGVEIQPWAVASYNFFQDKPGLINGVTVYGGIWNDVTTADTNFNGSWFEATLVAGINVNIAKNISLGLAYQSHTSPNDAFETCQEVVGTLAINDFDLWKDTALAKIPGFKGFQPFIQVGYVMDGTTGIPNCDGTWLEAGVRPSFDLPIKNLTLSFPVVVGFGLNDYYGAGTNDSYGFVRFGPEFVYPLTKNIDLTAGVQFMFLGDDTKALNKGDDFAIIGRTGIVFKF
jgi:hypothetical protein